MNDQLSEVFAPPIGLHLIAKVDGEPIYGSSFLNRSFLQALEKCGRTAPALSKFEMLLEKGNLIAGHQVRGIFAFRDWKLHQPSSQRTLTMGFYDRQGKKVYILISNNANKWSFVDNDHLGKLVIHESVHMFSDKKKALFVNMFKKELIAYYRELWKQVFSIADIPDKKVEKIVRHIFTDIEISKNLSTNTIVKYQAVMDRELRSMSTLNQAGFDKALNDYMLVTKVFLVNTDKFLQTRDQFKNILMPMYHAYGRAFGIKNMTTICIQELVFPSEVIAIASEDMRYGNKALKAIARI